MLYLICYDVEEDKTRKKISDKLLAYGLERVQYSVFMGPVSPPHNLRLESWLHQKSKQLTGEQDSILILNLQRPQVQKMRILGKSQLDPDMLAGIRHTLIL